MSLWTLRRLLWATEFGARIRERQEGQTMAEYAIVLGIITLAVVGVFTALGGSISGAINTVKGDI